MVVIVMGVSGSGKSTYGRALAGTLGWDFVEGDDFHPAANVAKMKSGRPLDDEDRRPWLERLHRVIAGQVAAGNSAVVACSALKRGYRELLTRNLDNVHFVYLCGERDIILERLRARTDHYMPPDLLDSQLATLEPPADAVLVSIELDTDRQVQATLAALGLAPGT